jgi:predicted nucleotidyltransferase
MKEALIKLQIGSLEQQIKVLKSKIVFPKKEKTLSNLYGIFEGKIDMSLEEIKKYETHMPTSWRKRR